jgi:hypothetical protein
VPTAGDRPSAAAVVRALRSARSGLVIAVGGAGAETLSGVVELPDDVSAAATTLRTAAGLGG